MYHMGIDEQYAEASALVGQDDASGASCEFRTGAMIPQKSMNPQDAASPAASSRTPSELQLKMCRSIWQFVCRHHMSAGDHLPERILVEALEVSRSPIRNALSHLAERGFVEKLPNRGCFLKVSGYAKDIKELEIPETAGEKIIDAITGEWFANVGPRSFSEAHFRKRHRLSRWAAARILYKLSDAGIITRNMGHGWQFEPSLKNEVARDQSYAFRMIIEPAAIRSPAFKLDHGLAEITRRDHKSALHSPVAQTSLGTLINIDAAFHRLIGVSSRNRYFLGSIERQNALRRVMKHGSWDKVRMLESCAQHLEILAALDKDHRKKAAQLMERHLHTGRREWPWQEPGS